MNEFKKSLQNTESNRISVTGLPYDTGSTFLKAKAPKFIRTALHSPSSNMWTELGINLGEKDIFTDMGDLDFKTSENSFSTIGGATPPNCGK
ncbi:MAG: hypothetical protein GY795_48440 [Desulfobacterales bacterium]|nr:hypothetical protein [Desulfobacterales bacterium]